MALFDHLPHSTKIADAPAMEPSYPPRNFDSLPRRPQAKGAWSGNVDHAHRLINESYRQAYVVLSQEADAIRLNVQIDNMMGNVLPMLEAMDRAREEEGIPKSWINEATYTIASMVIKLDSVIKSIEAPLVPFYIILSWLITLHARGDITYDSGHVASVHTGRRGRPRKTVNQEYLREAFKSSRNLSIKHVAGMLKIDRLTLKKNMDAAGDVNLDYSVISDSDLDDIVRNYQANHPLSGRRWLIGHLRSEHSLRLPKKRVTSSILRVNRVGQQIKRQAKLQRRVYKVSGPNALWHCDGHHKMIRWGIVIHGFIDGYSRTVSGLCYSLI